MTRVPRLLVIDDEVGVLAGLRVSLEQAGYAVDAHTSARSGLAALATREPDLVVLDVRMPDVGGFMALRWIRRRSTVAVLMLSAAGELLDKTTAFDGGADDYLVKPFAVPELLGRVRALLRRPRVLRGRTLRFEDLEVDPDTRTASRAAQPLDLSAREFDLLQVLLEEQGRVFGRSQLIARVWGRTSDVSPAVVDKFVSLLRHKLDRPGMPRLLHTVRGVGFALRKEP